MKKNLFIVLSIIGISLFSCTYKNQDKNHVIVEKETTQLSQIKNNGVSNSEIIEPLVINEYYLVDSKEGLRIRREPYQNSEKIGLIKNNTVVYLSKISSEIVEIDTIKAQWVFVSRDNQEGWVFGGYLKRIPKIDITIYEYSNFKKSYGVLKVEDFSEDWKSFYIFSRDYITPYHEMLLLKFNLKTELRYSDCKIITGLYERKDGFCSSFIAKININDENVLQIKTNDYHSKKILFMSSWTRNNNEYISVGSQFESEFFFYINKEDIREVTRWEEI